MVYRLKPPCARRAVNPTISPTRRSTTIERLKISHHTHPGWALRASPRGTPRACFGSFGRFGRFSRFRPA
eukprot:5279852-Prymnesium_polylepis.1